MNISFVGSTTLIGDEKQCLYWRQSPKEYFGDMNRTAVTYGGFNQDTKGVKTPYG